ncbi:hypothetical protein ES703_100658 [subsurface metagenome]
MHTLIQALDKKLVSSSNNLLSIVFVIERCPKIVVHDIQELRRGIAKNPLHLRTHESKLFRMYVYFVDDLTDVFNHSPHLRFTRIAHVRLRHLHPPGGVCSSKCLPKQSLEVCRVRWVYLILQAYTSGKIFNEVYAKLILLKPHVCKLVVRIADQRSAVASACPESCKNFVLPLGEERFVQHPVALSMVLAVVLTAQEHFRAIASFNPDHAVAIFCKQRQDLWVTYAVSQEGHIILGHRLVKVMSEKVNLHRERAGGDYRVDMEGTRQRC